MVTEILFAVTRSGVTSIEVTVGATESIKKFADCSVPNPAAPKARFCTWV